MEMMPPDAKFIGRPLTFSLIDSDEVVDYITTKYDYHKNGHKEAVFGIAVQCFPHYGAVCSTWVYVGCITPHASKGRKKKKKKGEGDDEPDDT